jgi:hypothetical protein
LLSLGIGFSAQEFGPQVSRVDVNGRRLTSTAGGHDDGVGGVVDGGLITAGGLGDSPLNPADPFLVSTNAFSDDELYNLALGNGVNPAPFINTGDTVLNFNTLNPSNNDNIFAVGLNITAIGDVPEPSAVAAAAGVLSLLAVRRRNH